MIRKMLSTILAIGFLISVPPAKPAIGDTTSDDVAQKAQEAMQSIKDYLVEKKKEAVAHGKMLVQKMDEEIEALEQSLDGQGSGYV